MSNYAQKVEVVRDLIETGRMDMGRGMGGENVLRLAAAKIAGMVSEEETTAMLLRTARRLVLESFHCRRGVERDRYLEAAEGLALIAYEREKAVAR